MRGAALRQHRRMDTPESVVDRQLAAYNRRDLAAWVATYAPDAQQVLADGTVLASGHAALADRMRARFSDAQLRAELLHRVVIGPTVADHERVTRTGTQGLETLEMLCVYSVQGGQIARATFAFGAARAA
jgi:putative hydrolase of HD superfamily